MLVMHEMLLLFGLTGITLIIVRAEIFYGLRGVVACEASA